MDKLTKLLNKEKFVIVDGAMATELEARGCNINDELWSAKILSENPALIEQVHYDYFAAGADIGISASYQASIPGFMNKGFTKKEDGAIVMDDATRKIVLTEWQNRKKDIITHPYLGEKIEWGMVPFTQAMLLARYLRGDLDEYPPFFWK